MSAGIMIGKCGMGSKQDSHYPILHLAISGKITRYSVGIATDRREENQKNSYVSAAGRRFKITPWFGAPGAALVVPQSSNSVLPGFLVGQICEMAAKLGFTSILYQVDTEDRASTLTNFGFEVADTLYVLIRPGSKEIPKTKTSKNFAIKRLGSYGYQDFMSIDHRCFNEFWRQDPLMMEDARTSTPRSHLRVGVVDDPSGEKLVGFCLYGLGMHEAYLQRIAIHPDFQGLHIGWNLAVDGLRWAKRWRARQVSVNTQTSNEKALSLYLGLGFDLHPERLWILKKDCGG